MKLPLTAFTLFKLAAVPLNTPPLNSGELTIFEKLPFAIFELLKLASVPLTVVAVKAPAIVALAPLNTPPLNNGELQCLQSCHLQHLNYSS